MKNASQITPMGLRLPPTVREQVEKTAEVERRSLNGQITVLIERGLRAPETKAATEAGTSVAAE